MGMETASHTQTVAFTDLGLIDYQQAWDRQTEIHRQLVEQKLAARKAGGSTAPVHHLLFCEHPPVYTLGKSGSPDHLLLSEAELQAGGFQYYKINRGGDITYHGPGQIVGYPIFDLEHFFTDVHRYVRYLEEAIMLTLLDYGLPTVRMPGYTGVWLEGDAERPNRKICAIGVHLSRWVTMHGFAFNVHPDLSHFEHIVPCGITDEDKAVTSMEQELGQAIDIEEVKSVLKRHFSQLFGFEYKG